MANMNHTPTPWEVYKPMKGKYRGDFAVGTTHKKDPLFCYLAKGRDDIQAANAAFIVRACNAHEKFIETLKELETDCLHLMQAAGVPNEKITKPYANSMLGRIQAALKLARGE
ncbi:hypothetical protein KGP36_07800 [Patescibacteria group bacterium]|nr:hypothetical protein [Patescibacteria group bacterium]